MAGVLRCSDPSDGRWKIAAAIVAVVGGVFLTGLLNSLFPAHLAAQPEPEDIRRENKVSKEFFGSLSRQEKLELIKFREETSEHRDRELGALYRWGYIPVDREIPAFLGQWWSELSKVRRNRRRLSWFRENKARLDVDLAARVLDKKELLFELQRRYLEAQKKRPEKFEAVSFSFDGSGTDTAEKETGGAPETEPADLEKSFSPKKQSQTSESAPAQPEREVSDEAEPEKSAPGKKTGQSEKEAEATPGSTGPVSDTQPAEVKKTEADSAGREMIDTAALEADTSAGSPTDTPVASKQGDSETEGEAGDDKRFYWSSENEIKVQDTLGSTSRNGETTPEKRTPEPSPSSPELDHEPSLKQENQASVDKHPPLGESAPRLRDLEITPPPMKNVD